MLCPHGICVIWATTCCLIVQQAVGQLPIGLLLLTLTLIAQLGILNRWSHTEQRLRDQPVQKSFQRHLALLAFFNHY